jgi:hypothetical protein
VFDEVEEAIEDVELIVLRLLAIREIDGPSSTKVFVFDSVQWYWTSNGNCQRLAFVCSKLWLKKDGAELTLAWS